MTDVLKHANELVAAHVFVGLAIEVIGSRSDDFVCHPSTPRRLKERQSVELIILVVNDNESFNIWMASKPI